MTFSLGRGTCNPKVPSSISTLATRWSCSSLAPSSTQSATLVNSQRLCLLQVGSFVVLEILVSVLFVSLSLEMVSRYIVLLLFMTFFLLQVKEHQTRPPLHLIKLLLPRQLLDKRLGLLKRW